jgi:hypothetical protein
MSTNICILIMDRNYWLARTDVIIICDSAKKLIYWLPRDLYCLRIKNRLNTAYAKGKDTLVMECLKDIGITVKYCVCILPHLINENIINIGEINISIPITRNFYYPLHRQAPIENGKRLITFTAPNEILAGDRIHEYIGARYVADNDIPTPYFPDFDRIRRQQKLLKTLLQKKYKFLYKNEENIRGINIEVIEILSKIDQYWQIEIMYEKDYKPIKIHKMDVLCAVKRY